MHLAVKGVVQQACHFGNLLISITGGINRQTPATSIMIGVKLFKTVIMPKPVLLILNPVFSKSYLRAIIKLTVYHNTREKKQKNEK